MNIKNLKALIRLSIKQRFLLEDRKRLRPLETFFDFNTAICDALVNEGFDIDDSETTRQAVFENLYEAWDNIQRELVSIPPENKVAAWNEVISYYIPTVVEDLKESLTHSASPKATKIIVSSLLR